MRYLHVIGILRRKAYWTITEVTEVEGVQRIVRTPQSVNFKVYAQNNLQESERFLQTLSVLLCIV